MSCQRRLAKWRITAIAADQASWCKISKVIDPRPVIIILQTTPSISRPFNFQMPSILLFEILMFHLFYPSPIFIIFFLLGSCLHILSLFAFNFSCSICIFVFFLFYFFTLLVISFFNVFLLFASTFLVFLFFPIAPLVTFTTITSFPFIFHFLFSNSSLPPSSTSSSYFLSPSLSSSPSFSSLSPHHYLYFPPHSHYPPSYPPR